MEGEAGGRGGRTAGVRGQGEGRDGDTFCPRRGAEKTLDTFFLLMTRRGGAGELRGKGGGRAGEQRTEAAAL